MDKVFDVENGNIIIMILVLIENVCNKLGDYSKSGLVADFMKSGGIHDKNRLDLIINEFEILYLSHNLDIHMSRLCELAVSGYRSQNYTDFINCMNIATRLIYEGP